MGNLGKDPSILAPRAEPSGATLSVELASAMIQITTIILFFKKNFKIYKLLKADSSVFLYLYAFVQSF